jgi:hypothetical protein
VIKYYENKNPAQRAFCMIGKFGELSYHTKTGKAPKETGI